MENGQPERTGNAQIRLLLSKKLQPLSGLPHARQESKLAPKLLQNIKRKKLFCFSK